MEFTGKIIAILPPRGGVSRTSGNEWKSQEFVIENHDQYPRKMCFDVFGADKIEQFNIQSRTCRRRRSNGSGCSRSSSGSVRYSGIYSGRRERRSAFLNKKNQGVTIRTEKLPVNLISAGSFLCPHFVKIPPTGKHFSAHR